MNANDPIGIFDSGTGGLTVARAVKDLLPNEQIIYFGDSAHLPYGDKSTATIQAYAVKISDILLQRRCKVVLIACNSASAAAFELIKEYTGSRAKVMNVIDPVVDDLSARGAKVSVGLIGTHQTVNSGVFENKLKDRAPLVTLKTLATPLLVPMIEEGFVHNKISHDVIENYLNAPELAGISSLILGCTHYPIIKDEIDEFYGGAIDLIDSAQAVAAALKAYLGENGLMNTGDVSEDQFLFSDLTEGFKKAAGLFFGEQIHLEKYQLWE